MEKSLRFRFLRFRMKFLLGEDLVKAFKVERFLLDYGDIEQWGARYRFNKVEFVMEGNLVFRDALSKDKREQLTSEKHKFDDQHFVWFNQCKIEVMGKILKDKSVPKFWPLAGDGACGLDEGDQRQNLPIVDAPGVAKPVGALPLALPSVASPAATGAVSSPVAHASKEDQVFDKLLAEVYGDAPARSTHRGPGSPSSTQRSGACADSPGPSRNTRAEERRVSRKTTAAAAVGDSNRPTGRRGTRGSDENDNARGSPLEPGPAVSPSDLALGLIDARGFNEFNWPDITIWRATNLIEEAASTAPTPFHVPCRVVEAIADEEDFPLSVVSAAVVAERTMSEVPKIGLKLATDNRPIPITTMLALLHMEIKRWGELHGNRGPSVASPRAVSMIIQMAYHARCLAPRPDYLDDLDE